MKNSRYSDRYFEHHFSSSDLERKTAKGGVVLITAQFLRFFIQVISTVILARIISPEGFGLFGMVLVVVTFVNTLKNAGLSEATIQRKEITVPEVSNIFWINLLICTFFGLFVLGVSPLISSFFDQPELLILCMSMSIPLVLQGVSIQYRALITRSFEFKSLACVDVFSQLIGTIFAIVSALNGLGYWALVVQVLTSAGVEMAMLILITRWLPQRYDTRVSVRPFLSYGFNLAGANLLNYTARSVDNIIIGRTSSAYDLGVYIKAYQLLLMPVAQINNPATKVALPYLSRYQADSSAFREAYKNCLFAISFLTIPIIGFMSVASNEIILVVLGPKWVDAVLVFQVLLPAVFVTATNVATGWVYQSLGTTRRQLLWTLFATPFMVFAMLFAARWGMLGVAVSVSLSMFLLRPFGIMYCFRGTPLGLADFYKTILSPTLMAFLASFFVIYTENIVLNVGPPLFLLILKLLIYVLFFCLLELIMYRGCNFSKIKKFWRIVR